MAGQVPCSLLEPSRLLSDYSYLVNPDGYWKRTLLIGKLKQELQAKLFFKQKSLCPLCLNILIDLNYTCLNESQDMEKVIDRSSLQDIAFSSSSGPTVRQNRYDKLVNSEWVLTKKWYFGRV